MENSDREYIFKMLRTNNELRRLYEEHIELEDKLSRFGNRAFLTTQEELEQKALKFKKLKGVDRMMEIITQSKHDLLDFTVEQVQ